MPTVREVVHTINELRAHLAVWEEISSWLSNREALPPIRLADGSLVPDAEINQVIHQINSSHIEILKSELESIEMMEVEE